MSRVTETARTASRTRRDLCPGVLRPWPAEDGALVRVRLVGGLIPVTALRRLGRVAATYGDGNLQLTSRANLQLRGLPHADGTLDPQALAALEATGLLPHPTHDLVRNVMVSPLTGLHGGRANLRPVAAAYDAALCADPALAALPGKFLVVLDDGRGDLVDHSLDLGAVAVDEQHAQLRAGEQYWGDVVTLEEVPHRLVALAHAFLRARGEDDTAGWHVDELPEAALGELHLRGERDPRTTVTSDPLPFEGFGSGIHIEVPDGILTPQTLKVVLDIALTDHVIVTPWRGLVLPTR
jgi:precorrin-3B synthase